MNVSKKAENLTKAVVVGTVGAAVVSTIVGDLNGWRGHNSSVPDTDKVSWNVPLMK